MNPTPKLLLASNSPRRKKLISLGKWIFTIFPVNIDESRFENEMPEEHVLRLAQAKAWAAVKTTGSDTIVLGADTVVVDDPDILGKPNSSEDAVNMLRRLRGRVHQVYTGIALLNIQQGKMVTDLCITDVPMRSYTDDEINAYVSSGDPLDKAGAYAIQHAGFHPVVNLQGCYASVMGLPLCHIVRTLQRMLVQADPGVAKACQEHLNYQCPVSESILNFERVG
ncbi:MAG: septum formation protein Maf [Chloroflexi bacterium RBG_16_51_16]|nr:MAG: septum formation protein Maf [Chloroflexi bacterium RBG_16_51_16]